MLSRGGTSKAMATRWGMVHSSILCVLVVSVIRIGMTPSVVNNEYDTSQADSQLFTTPSRSDYPNPFRDVVAATGARNILSKAWTSSSSLGKESQCASKAKGYANVVCPVWYDESKEGVLDTLDPISRERGIDYRVRYFHRHQHSKDCESESFLVNTFVDSSMINAFYQTVGRGLWGAINSDRVSKS